MTTLAAHDLEHRYRNGVTSLRGVSLSVDAGELVAVVGPNGAGKSTLVDVLAGLRAPDAGRVTIDGAALADFSPRERARRIAVVPQTLATIPPVTVARFVFAGRYAHVARWRGATEDDVRVVDEALDAAGLRHLAGRRLTELSGGQRQRVVVARALAQRADVVLVDEPTAALDPEHQLAVFELLAGLREGGRAVVVVTHDLNLAAQFASRVVLLDAGRIVRDGGVDEIVRRDVLAPVYGERLRVEDVDGVPVVLPWRGAGEGAR